MNTRISKSRIAVLGILFIFATAFAPFIGGDQRNYLVILTGLLAGPIILIFRFSLGADLIWVSVVALDLLMVVLLKGQSGDFSTIGYTAVFMLAYLAFVGGIRTHRIEIETILTFLRKLIYLFTAVSILQLITSFIGLPVLNKMLSKGLWSYNSLAVEPSHAGRFLAITMLTYLILLRESSPTSGRILDHLRGQRNVIAAFLVCIWLTGSALAAIAAPLALLFSFRTRWMLGLLVLISISWPMLYLIDVPVIQRALIFVTALPSMEITTIVEADQSGALRILPLLIFLEKASVTDLSFWVGGGIDAIRGYVQGELIGAGDAAGAGFIPGYIIVFGMVGTFLFMWAFVFRFLNIVTLPIAVLWILLFSSSAWNSQLFWYGLMLLRLAHYFTNTTQSTALPTSTKGRVL